MTYLALSVPYSHEEQRRVCDKINKEKSLLFPGMCLTSLEVQNLGKKGREYSKQLKSAVNLEPVVLVPGLCGSGIEVEVSQAIEPHYYCYSNYGWRRLWLNIAALLPGERDCFYHNIDIFYNETTNTYYNNPGVQTRPIDWGGVSGIDYLDYELGIGVSLTSYFAPVIEDLKALGYVVGKNVRGAPFDWRKPYNPDNFIENFRKLIEETYTINGNKRVNIIGHSMGSIHSTQFLNFQTQEWKDKYISALITVSAPWGGSPKALRSIISGDNFGIEVTSWLPLIDAKRVRPTLRRAGGVIYMLPDIGLYNTTEIVKTPTKSYSAVTMPQLLDDIGSPVSKAIWYKVHDVMDKIVGPKVETHCLYGINFPTEEHYTYNNGWDNQPEITFSHQGDGTITDDSLRRCLDFEKEQSQPVFIKEFDLADHLTVLNDQELIDYILKLLVTNSNKQR